MNNQTKQNRFSVCRLVYINRVMSKYIGITIFDYIKYNAVRFLKSTMYKQRMWEMYVEPNQILVYTNVQRLNFNLLNTLVLQELIINLSLHSRFAKIIIISPVYWIIIFKIIDQSGCKTDQPMPGPFSLTIQPRKQKALGTRLIQYIFHNFQS